MQIARGRAPSQGPLRCAIYTRQSVRSESDLTSCEVQRDLCCQFLRNRHPSFVRLDEHFDDEGVSGATLDRPGLQRLFQKVRAGEVDARVVHRLDRLARRLLDCAGLLGELRERGVRLFIAAMPEIAAGAFDMFLLNLLSTFAEFERELIGSRNPTYSRRFGSAAGIREGCHEAIVSAELFGKLRGLRALDERALESTRLRGTPLLPLHGIRRTAPVPGNTRQAGDA